MLLDPLDRVLLILDSDPGARGRPQFWVTPGGGIEREESLPVAAAREVLEETGHPVEPAAFLGPVAHRSVRHAYSDIVVDQEETYLLARVPIFDAIAHAFTPGEQATVLGHRWWTLAELRATDELIFPAGLADLVALLLDGWSGGLIPLPSAEESTVPA